MIFSLPFLFDTVMPKLLAAVPTTLALTLVSGSVSVLLGVPLALAADARHTPLRWSARGWLMLIRGTPLLVQLYLLYYGFGQIVPREWRRDSWASPLLRWPHRACQCACPGLPGKAGCSTCTTGACWPSHCANWRAAPSCAW